MNFSKNWSLPVFAQTLLKNSVRKFFRYGQDGNLALWKTLGYIYIHIKIIIIKSSFQFYAFKTNNKGSIKQILYRTLF